MNQLCLSATLVEREALRYTPAGIPVVALKLAHQSMQLEAGAERRVELEISAVAAANIARRVNQLALGSELRVTGFLAARRRHAKAMVLHLTGLELQDTPSAAPQTPEALVTPI